MNNTRTAAVTPLMGVALKSFKRARKAMARGRVDEMIGLLTRGMDTLAVIKRAPAGRP
jgi:hypothetical protein